MLLPFMRPPDIPRIVGNDGLLLPLSEQLAEELALELIVANTFVDETGNEQPLVPPLTVSMNIITYPMHSHMELDQTAAGGNYPQGQVAHWEIHGDYEKNVSFRPDRRNVISPQLLPLLLDD